jgi:hypothetical protein
MNSAPDSGRMLDMTAASGFAADSEAIVATLRSIRAAAATHEGGTW